VASVDETPAEAALTCAECGREPRENKNAADDAYSDGVGELRVFCPECAGREFGCG
jgi:hypothetical protein